MLAACHLLADIEPGQPECRVDGKKNGLETDVDCGGSCAKCDDEKVCTQHEDCASNSCAGGHCQPPECYDGRRNGNETDVDCGGDNPACARCQGGQGCKVDSDCASSAALAPGVCSHGVCAAICCYGDCLGCVKLCSGGCCNDPNDPEAACCPSMCDPKLLGSPCSASTPNDCEPPLMCLDTGVDTRCL